MNKIRNTITIAALAVMATVAAFSLFPVEQARAGDESGLAYTNVIQTFSVTATQATLLCSAPNGFIPIHQKFKVLSGTLTVSGGGFASTNVTIGGGAATNSFFIPSSAGSITSAATFANGDGWVDIGHYPIQNISTISCICTGTYGGLSVSGYQTGTVNSASIAVWTQGRTTP
jgi:hypothetical protein